MARNSPTIPGDKVSYFRDKLFREVSNLFIWKGLPKEIPIDYLEDSLVRTGRVMFFEDENAFGPMILDCTVRGYNVYGEPVEAVGLAPNTEGQTGYYIRTIVHSYNSEIGRQGCILINNMYKGESLHSIVEFYAQRLALLQQAFDTNALWQNLPVVFNVSDSTTKLSVEKFFDDIMSGKPWVIIDEQLRAIGKESVVSAAVEIPFLLDKLHDAQNEVYSTFKATVGINTSGADKKERLVVDEVQSNNQATQTCLQIMLSQRQKACNEIKAIFGLDVSVSVVNEGGEEDGTSDNRTKTPITD